MTKLIVAALAGLIAGLSATPDGPVPAPPAARVAVVANASGPGAAARIAAAKADATARHAAFRAPLTLHDQLSVTARLAAEHYGTIVGYGLAEQVAITPLDGRVRYIAAG